MATGDAARRYLESGMAATMPQMRQQQETMRRILGGHGQRIGSKGAVQQARKSVEGYAQQKAWEKQFAESQKQNRFSQLMAQYKATGVMTPELMKEFGLSDISRGDIRERDRQLELLGIASSGEQAPYSGGPFGANNKMLYERAMMPGPQFSNRAQRNQQAWLRNQFG
jgi:hypothetical protein